MELLLVGIGGLFGGITRFHIGKIISQKSVVKFPLGTLIINITGAVLLGMVTSVDAGNNIYLLFGDGFLGAYTTFSTFMYEGFCLFRGNKKKNALTYIIGSLILGIAGYAAGYALGKLIMS